MAKDTQAITEPTTTGNTVATTGDGPESFEDTEYLKKWILDCKREAEGATSDLRKKWETLWELYKNEQDYSKKESWQSKTCIPKLAMAIERASLLVEKAVLQTSKLFDVELDDEFVLPLKEKIRAATKQFMQAQKQAAAITKEAEKLMGSVQDAQGADPTVVQLLETHRKAMLVAEQSVQEAQDALDAAQEELRDHEDQAEADDERFKAHLKKTNFISAYGEMIKPALLLGIGIIKRIWKGKKRLSYETKAAENIYIAPDYLPFEDVPPRYIIEYKEMDLATLLDMAKRANSSKEEGENEGDEGPFIMSEVEKISEDYSAKEEERTKRLTRLGLNEYTDVTKRVAVLEFWGQIASKDGKEIRRDRLMMLANEKYLIRNQGNPHDDKKPPYQLTIPIVFPGRGATGISMIEHETKLQWTLNNLLNLFVDHLTFTGFPMFEYDPQKLQEPEKMTRVFPGKRILTKPNTTGPVVSQVKTQGIGTDAFKVYEIFGKEIQEASAVTEFLTAMPGKQAKTLGEIEIKTAESHGYFDVIARKLELNSVRPLLRDSYAMLEQFTDTFKNLEQYQFSVNGVTLLLMERKDTENLMQAIVIGGRTPNITDLPTLQELYKHLLSKWNLDSVADRAKPPAEGLPPQGQPQLQPQPPAAPQLPAMQGAA
jgi:hypothetical protein